MPADLNLASTLLQAQTGLHVPDALPACPEPGLGPAVHIAELSALIHFEAAAAAEPATDLLTAAKVAAGRTAGVGRLED